MGRPTPLPTRGRTYRKDCGNGGNALPRTSHKSSFQKSVSVAEKTRSAMAHAMIVQMTGETKTLKNKTKRRHQSTPIAVMESRPSTVSTIGDHFPHRVDSCQDGEGSKTSETISRSQILKGSTDWTSAQCDSSDIFDLDESTICCGNDSSSCVVDDAGYEFDSFKDLTLENMDGLHSNNDIPQTAIQESFADKTGRKLSGLSANTAHCFPSTPHQHANKQEDEAPCKHYDRLHRSHENAQSNVDSSADRVHFLDSARHDSFEVGVLSPGKTRLQWWLSLPPWRIIRSPVSNFECCGSMVTIIDWRLRIFVIDLVPPQECDWINASTEMHAQTAASGSQETFRKLYTYTDLDLPCCEIRALGGVISRLLGEIRRIVGRVLHSRRAASRLYPRSWKEPHLLRYQKIDGEPEHTGMGMHYDGSQLTWQLMLSEHGVDYTGGGTYFNSLRRTVRLKKGQILIHPGGLFHKAVEIEQGVRTLMVCFMDGFNPGVVDGSNLEEDSSQWERQIVQT